MPIAYAGDLASFTGDCTVEEAFDFVEWLRGREAAQVDLAACSHLHASLLQALLALRPPLVAAPADPFLAGWVAPHLPAPAAACRPPLIGPGAQARPAAIAVAPEAKPLAGKSKPRARRSKPAAKRSS